MKMETQNRFVKNRSKCKPGYGYFNKAVFRPRADLYQLAFTLSSVFTLRRKNLCVRNIVRAHDHTDQTAWKSYEDVNEPVYEISNNVSF